MNGIHSKAIVATFVQAILNIMATILMLPIRIIHELME